MGAAALIAAVMYGCVHVCVGMDVWVCMSLCGVIVCAKSAMCGWGNLHCCNRACVCVHNGDYVGMGVIVWVCGCDYVGKQGRVWVRKPWLLQ